MTRVWIGGKTATDHLGAMSSPCIDVCHHDDETGFCLGCGMTRKDCKHWKREKEQRPAIRAALPGRLSLLAAAGNPVGEAARKKKRR
ncbi:DUF1289 domain-containing protein [Falsiroseomonas stagni]|uniref:Predicted Fe-S protein YdhL, DUF1289 family n=1 Tax=Falsiroseomonas stagni DSM 19981 TaxID=1123062 RepID=A0A1I3XZR2_9PROT|nr:DUF1289 domain-containing protein [Falsiroseomonas stagni]SFK24476.1 Predicted Fe-S protein YdhL, DUF1289 family [Falsiroseomonas stagni DSM 19981]